MLSPFKLKAAITATTIKANSTVAYVEITFGISSPYCMTAISNQHDADTGGPAGTNTGIPFTFNNEVDRIAVAYVVDENTVTPLRPRASSPETTLACSTPARLESMTGMASAGAA